MRKHIENYFQFTRSERIGIFILLFLSLLTWLSYPIYTHFVVDKTKTDFSKFKKEIALLEITINEAEEKEGNNFQKFNNAYSNTDYPKKYNRKKEKAVITPFAFNPNSISQADLLVMGIPKNAIDNLIKFRNKGAKFYKKTDFKKVYGITDDIYNTIEQFIQLPISSTKKLEPEKYPELKEVARELTPQPFNPNTISKSAMVEMGISDKVASTIERFRNKGGTFRKKEDLSRIYGLKATDYSKLESFINIPIPEKPKKEFANAAPKFVKKKKETQPIDINKATIEDWSTLNGIGAGRSKMIVAYREKLGGFYTINQVSETFGLPDSTFQQIKPFLIIDESNLKININEVTIDGLKKHPYLNFRQAKAIVNYRSNHGAFESASDIAKVRALTKNDVEKILPYLAVDGSR